jgi:hypothetical protein
VSDTLATIPTGPSRDELKYSVDCLAFRRRPLLDRSQQHLVDGRQSPAVGFGLCVWSIGHCATPLPPDVNRELSSHDNAQCTSRGHHSQSIRQATERRIFIFERDENRRAHSASSVVPPGLRLTEVAGLSWRFPPHLLKEHRGGKSIREKILDSMRPERIIDGYKQWPPA